jgi:Fe2+ transport system protein B
MSLSTTAYDKELSLRINKVIIQELIKFNFDKKTTKALNDLKFVTYRTDSVFRAYEALKYHSAEYLDQNKYLIKATVKVPQEDMDEKKKILSSRYLKLVEMQEQALIRTQTEKPVIQILDQPYIDSIEKPSKSGAAIVYGMLGLLFGFVFSIRKVLGKLISTELSKTISGLQPTEETTLDPTIESKDSFEL